MKKIISLFICTAMILTCFTSFASSDTNTAETANTTTTTATHKITFNDVNETTDEGKAIYKLVDAGVINGNGDGTFTPQNGITRAEFCKMINLVYNYTEKDHVLFTDVKSSDWYYEQVLNAKKAGYIQGYEDGTFRGDNNITRQEFCTIITRINNLSVKGTAPTISDEVESWAVEYVNAVLTNSVLYSADNSSKNLMSLEAGNTFRATVPIKRGEVAVVLAPCYDVVNKIATFSQATIPVTPTTPGGSSSGGSSSGGSSGGGSSGGSSGGSVVINYTIQFQTNGGSAISNQTVKSGNKVTEPTAPTRAGYIFDGWYTDANLTSKYNFNTTVTKSFTLYAKWTVNENIDTTTKYTVTFNSNGGSAVSSVQVSKNDTVVEPAKPTRSGYIFNGWYTDSALTQAYNFSTAVTGNFTLYAKWTKEPSIYTVSFNSNGGTAVESQTVYENEAAYEPTSPTWSGYSFAGWYKDSACTVAYDFDSKVTGNLTLYAKWEQSTFTVTFNSMGGSGVSSQTVERGDYVSEPDEPTRDTYQFLGWYTDSALTNAYDFNSRVTSSFTLYAKWEKISKYTVTFNSKGGSAVAKQTVEKNGTIDEPSEPSRENYFFEGWYLEDFCYTEYDFGTPVTKSFTLYAKWTFDSSINTEIVEQLTKAKNELDKFLLTGGYYEGDAQYEIISIAVNVLGSVIDEDQYIYEIKKETIAGNYLSEYYDAKELFENMDDRTQSSFVNDISQLDEETFNFLCEFFQIDPSEYM